MRISDWSSDVCSSDLTLHKVVPIGQPGVFVHEPLAPDLAAGQLAVAQPAQNGDFGGAAGLIEVFGRPRLGAHQDHGDSGVSSGHLSPSVIGRPQRSEEHTSELQSLMRISYAVFCLKKKKRNK